MRRLINNLLHDLAIISKDDLVDLERGLDGVGLVVDPLELLEGAALGFDTVFLRVHHVSHKTCFFFLDQ